MSQIRQFYSGQNIFITGGTGFLGKILTEKLLRSCPDIGTIYLLIRAKKGKITQERIDALLVDPVFDKLRSDYPDFSKKIVAVAGDVAEEGLGLSTADLARLVNEVSVIFHLAATVRFDEKLDKAVAINVNSVKYVVDIAKECRNLKVGIYVSTAYSHCVRKSIDEELYPPPLSYEKVNKFVEDAAKNKWSEEEMKKFTEGVVGEWPNTYSFTKAIAEGVIVEFANEMPFAIFRPSIVMSTYREPIPGWVAGPIGLPGLVCAIGLGLIHVALLDLPTRVDIVPVDYVCNALISSAWETAIAKRRYIISRVERMITMRHGTSLIYYCISDTDDLTDDQLVLDAGPRPPGTLSSLQASHCSLSFRSTVPLLGFRHDEGIPVYNYVSGNENPVTWQQLYERGEIFGRAYPLNKAVYYPSGFQTSSKWMFSILHVLLHLIPALIIDSIAKLFGKQLGLYKLARRLGNAWVTVSYFTLQQWDFENQRTQNLWKRLGPMDKQTFPFNMQHLDWDEHCMKMIKGLRKYIVGDPNDNVEQARRRHFYLYIVHMMVRLASGSFVLWMAWKLFSGYGGTFSTETFAV